MCSCCTFQVGLHTFAVCSVTTASAARGMTGQPQQGSVMVETPSLLRVIHTVSFPSRCCPAGCWGRLETARHHRGNGPRLNQLYVMQAAKSAAVPDWGQTPQPLPPCLLLSVSTVLIQAWSMTSELLLAATEPPDTSVCSQPCREVSLAAGQGLWPRLEWLLLPDFASRLLQQAAGHAAGTSSFPAGSLCIWPPCGFPALCKVLVWCAVVW